VTDNGMDSELDPGRGRSRRPLLVVATLVVLVIAVAGAVAYGRRGQEPASGSAGTADRRAPVADSPPANPADLVVRDGVTVEGEGLVLAAPDKPVRLCSTRAVAMLLAAGSETSQVPPCVSGIPVTGVDLARLNDAQEINGVRFGYATLRGTWRGEVPDGMIEVTAQFDDPPEPPPPPVTAYPVQAPPCPEPDGGWQPNPEGLGNQVSALYPYLYGHADRFRHPDVVHPYGGSNTAPQETSVLVVEVTSGDVDLERNEIRKLYPLGNLCVTAASGKPSIAEQGAQAEPIMRVLDQLRSEGDRTVYEVFGLQGGGPHDIGGVNDDHVWMGLTMLTPKLYDLLAPVGFEHAGFRPWIRPVR
jgi:hypothetical protein